MKVNSETNFRILVIDDNPSIHDDFIKILTKRKSGETLELLDKQLFGENKSDEKKLTLPTFQIDCVSQGQDGVKKIVQSLKEKQPYSLAFVDIRMPPGWDGIETIKHIWKHDPDVQIVICTAYSDYTWESTIQHLGMTDNLLILKKPFDHIAIRQFACALTKKWQLLKEKRNYRHQLENKIKTRTESLQHSISVMRATLESSNDGILVTSNKGDILDFNNQFLEIWSISKSTMLNSNYEMLIQHMSDQLVESTKFKYNMEKLKNNKYQINNEILNFKNKHVFEFHTKAHTIEKQSAGRVWTFHDITEQIYLKNKLEYQATHDSLTNLPNRVLLDDRVNQAIANAKRTNTEFAVLFFDLDRFKLVNDSLNHFEGDKLLKLVANRMRDEMRKGDTLARLGGDEFIVIVPNLDNKKHLADIAKKLLSVINQPFKIDAHEINLTSSLGISVYPYDGKNFDELLRNADLAMYLAKGEGLNNYKFYSPELNAMSLQRLEKETELRHAIERKELYLCYQPQYDIKTEKLVAVEALVRWKHPTYGEMLPIDFIPLAEDTGLIISIGDWILHTACQQNKMWQKMGLPKIRIAVNIGNHQLNQPNFVSKVLSILKETDLHPKYLELELTENIIFKNAHAVKIIEDLVKAGLNVSFDDFGTGNSSLNYLRQVPINQLKIDRSFIKNINSDRNDEIIIRAIISMANNLNIDVIAEGVETKDQLDFLKKQKCHEVQGYYFSKPLSQNEFEKYLKQL